MRTCIGGPGSWCCLTRGKVAEVWKNANWKLVVQAEDTLTGEAREDKYNMVTLATPTVPPDGLIELAEKMKVP
jgi:heterodisulfide reductase subunit A-like polyferredoxin